MSYQVAVAGKVLAIPVLTDIPTFRLAMRSIHNRFDMLHTPKDRQYVIIHNGIVMRRVKRRGLK